MGCTNRNNREIWDAKIERIQKYGVLKLKKYRNMLYTYDSGVGLQRLDLS